MPPFSDNLGNPNTSWSASFFAGDSIVFNLEAGDYLNSSQVISLITHGIQNAPNIVDFMANACLYPSCSYFMVICPI